MTIGVLWLFLELPWCNCGISWSYSLFAIVYPAIYCRKLDVIMKCHVLLPGKWLAATDCRHNILHFHCLFEGKFSFEEQYRRIYIRKSWFLAPLTRWFKAKFQIVYPTIYPPPPWKFWIQLYPVFIIVFIIFFSFYDYPSDLIAWQCVVHTK